MDYKKIKVSSWGISLDLIYCQLKTFTDSGAEK